MDQTVNEILEAEGQPQQAVDNSGYGSAPVEGTQDNNQVEQGQPAAQAQPGKPATVGGDPNWNPEHFPLKFRDQIIKPKSREELIGLAQQGYSYSQRMHQLNEKEQQLNAQAQQYAQYQKLEQAFEQNPGFRKQILDWYNNSLSPAQQQEQKEGNAGASQLPPEIVNQIRELTEFKSTFEQHQQQQMQEQVDTEVRKEMDDLKQKYPREDWEIQNSNGLTLMQEIVKHSIDNGGIKLESAFRDKMFDQHTQNVQAETLKKQAEEAAAAKKAGVVSAGKGKGATPAQQPNPAGMDYSQIEKMIKAEYNIS
jgi:hypothetical protein